LRWRVLQVSALVGLVCAVLAVSAVGAARPPAPAGVKVLAPGAVPHVCGAGDQKYGATGYGPVYGVYFSKTANAWVQAPLCYPQWGNLQMSGAQIARGGGRATVTATPNQGSNSAVWATKPPGAITWQPAGTPKGGCTPTKLTCTVQLPAAGAEWQWLMFQVTLPRTYFIDSPGEFCAGVHACPGTATNGWTFVGIPPKGQEPPLKPADECAGCGPTLTVVAAATRIDPQGGGTLSIKATVRTPANKAIKNAKLQVEVSPATGLKAVSAAAVSVVVGDVPEKSTRTTTLKPVPLAPVVVADGGTIPGMNTWTTNGWSTNRGVAILGGGDLVYSDSPEYLATSTSTSGGKGGVNGEGVLYAQRGSTTSGTRRPDFRVYLNHENRTARPKALCLVFTSPTGGAVTVSRGPLGLAKRFANPVAAGKLALINYEQSRRADSRPKPLTVPAGGAVADCVTTIGQKKGYAEVANGIFDFTSSGPVQVGVVAVNAGRAPGFERDPLGFRFIDDAHPQGNPNRSYTTDAPLKNAGETHVSGTFPYNEVDVKLPRFEPDNGTRIGVRLAGKPQDDPHEYTRSVDTGQINLGNYGVFYNVTVDIGGTPEQSAQLLLNPRAVGHNEAAKVTNGYAGVVDVPATPIVQKPSRPPIGTPTGDKNLTDPDLGIGIGRAAGASTFSFSFMPPGGASLPVAVIASPAFVTVKATLTYSGGHIDSKPVTITLRP
jgi:hypothetical protein